MKLEKPLQGALPRTPLERWNDEQLATIFATGVNYSEYHQRGNMDRWLKPEDAEFDFKYLQSQLSQAGISTDGVLTPEVFRSFHGIFDLRPIIAAFMRELETRQRRQPITEALPPLESLRTAENKVEDRLKTFRDALLRNSIVPEPRYTSPSVFGRLENLNPVGRRFDQINILQIPSLI